MRRLLDERGFSLTELLVAMGILLIVVGSTFSMLHSGHKTERATRARADALDELRVSVDRMTKELRQALDVDLSSTRSRLEMVSLVAGVQHTIVYEVSAGTLRRTLDTGDPVPLVSGLQSADIFCYDPPTCALAAPDSANPKLLRVSVNVVPERFDHGSAVGLTTDVHVRNTSG